MDDKGLKGNGGALKAEIFFFVEDCCIRVKVVIMKIDDGEIMRGKEKKNQETRELCTATHGALGGRLPRAAGVVRADEPAVGQVSGCR